jgi:Capsule assembly protein Wzi
LKLFTKIFYFIFFAISIEGVAQNNELGSILHQDDRNNQLLKGTDSLKSFAIQSTEVIVNAKSPFFYWKPLPISFINQYNSHHPYGYNDGAMIPANGYQAQISAGVFAKAGPLQVQLKPEYIYASNTSYEQNAQYGYSNNQPYKKLFSGQSSISLSMSAISIGLSSQNLWWGPGVTSALLMSNNAPGFEHVYLKTRRPIKTFIGSFEFQLIGGRLQNDTAMPYENFHLKSNVNIVNNARYTNAYVLSYHPKWVPGLFLGINRSLNRYENELNIGTGNFFSKYLPILSKTLQKKNDWGDDTLKTDQLGSFFIRWVMPKSKAEFYVEYGFNDYGVNTRDYLMAPTHSSAHVIGFKKLKSLNSKTYLDFNVEITQLSQSPDAILRSAGNWYVHGQIGQGYTNYNQILGAGAGYAANKQIISAIWVNGYTKLGILLERTDRDPEYHYNKWIDLSIGILPQVKYKNYIIGGAVELINSSNYMWEKDLNKLNFHSKINIQYVFPW